MTRFVILLVNACIGFTSVIPVVAQHQNLENGVALHGYDAVAYFTEQKAVKGSKEVSVNHQGVHYYFSSEANKKQFLENPSAFLPAYGGWCAYAMGATGEKVNVDPETFKVANGRLYLFYNRFLNNTLTKWNADEAKLKLQADRNWNKIVQ